MNADPVCLKENQGRRRLRKPIQSAATASLAQRVRVREGRPWQLHVSITPTERRHDRSEGLPLPSARVRHARSDQELEIVNSDPTLHNIHALPKDNKEFNTGQPIQGMKTAHTFTQPRK